MNTFHRIGVAAGAITLLLSACSSPSSESPVAEAPAPQTPAESPEPEVDGPEADGPEADAPSDAPADPEEPARAAPDPAPDDPTCLIGQWVVTEADMQRFYDSMNTPATFTVSGDTGLVFTADTYEYTPGFTLDIDMSGMGASGTLTGSIAGSYVAEGGVITTSNEENDIDLTVKVGATTMDGSDLGEGFLMSSPVNSAEYVCATEGPIITWQNTSDGVDIQLTKAG